MLRLDPAFPPLWRTASTLQFGADAAVIIDEPAPWQERLLDELQRGVPEAALEPIARMLGAPPSQADPFVARIRPALQSAPAVSAGRVELRVPAGFAPADSEALTSALSGFGSAVCIGDAESLMHEPAAGGVPVVLVAFHQVDPRHAAALMRDDVTHLPIVVSGRDLTIGPVVRPGFTACLACLDARRRDADPSWPMLAAQLVGRPGSSPGRVLATEAGVAAGRLLSEPEGPVAHSVTIRVESSRRTWRAHQPHAECRCRSLGGSATAGEQQSRATETTTPTASVRLA